MADDALDSIVALTEDDTGKPEVCMYNEDGPPSTSQAAWKLRRSLFRGVRPAPAVEEHGPACGNLCKAPEPGQRSLPLRQRVRSTRSATEDERQPLRRWRLPSLESLCDSGRGRHQRPGEAPLERFEWSCAVAGRLRALKRSIDANVRGPYPR